MIKKTKVDPQLIVHDPGDFGLTNCGIDRTKGVDIPVSSKNFNCPDCIEKDKRCNPSKYIKKKETQRRVERFELHTLTEVNAFITEMKIKKSDILSMWTIRPTADRGYVKYEIFVWIPNKKKDRKYKEWNMRNGIIEY